MKQWINPGVAVSAILLSLLAACSVKTQPNVPPRNPYLADSHKPMTHFEPAQQDAISISGPTGPTRVLGPEDIKYVATGPGPSGSQTSSPYKNGRRVIWGSGFDRITKIDHDTFQVLATYRLPDRKFWTAEEAEEAINKFEILAQPQRLGHAMQLAATIYGNISGVYTVLDRDGNFFVSGGKGITIYGDAVKGDPDSEIAVLATWQLPEEVTGKLVGMNMTWDGRLILVTDHGYVAAVSLDFSQYHAVKMRHSEHAVAYSEKKRKAGQGANSWVRNGYAVDDQGGIYIVSNDYMHKVVWTGERLSIDEKDGAWTEPYLNGGGFGSGATPSLMGFGNEDKFVVITDGEKLMNVVLYWRNNIPENWEQLPETPSPRIAGMLPANMGDANRTAIKSEQSVIVAGYGAVVVNNEPASVPKNFPPRARGLLVGYLGADPDFTPYGIQKFEWDPKARKFSEAWVNTEISSPNALPVVSYGSNTFYTIGVRNGKWSLEGLDWATGESTFHWVIGGERYNAFYAGLLTDEYGRIIYTTVFGKVRLEP